MAKSEEADIYQHIPRSIEEEDYSEQEEQVVVTGNHVFGADIHKWHYRYTIVVAEKLLCSLIDAMPKYDIRKETRNE